MKYDSNLPYYAYLSAMKEQMSGFTEFGIERFTGTIIGGFFSITYHSGHEFNRRITNEKHRAIGFAKPTSSAEQTIKRRAINRGSSPAAIIFAR